MDVSLEQVLTVLVNVGFWIGLAWLLFSRFYLALALTPILISVSLRVLSVSYIDLFGPVYSTQLYTLMGPGVSSVYLIVCYTAFLVPMAIVLDRTSFRCSKMLLTRSRTNINGYFDVVFYGVLFIYLFVLYVQLVKGDVIPLFDHIERYDFADHHAGPLHDYLFKYSTIVTLVLGGQTVYAKLTKGKYDRRAFICILVILVYAFLTGHRFAAFNKFIAFFLVPFGLLYVQHYYSKLTTRGKQIEKGGRLVLGIVILGFSIAVLAILNSYNNVRTESQEKVFSRIQERLLIQQGELWVEQLVRVKQNEQDATSDKIEFLFYDPIISNQNTSIQYLMWLSLGSEAERLLGIGQQYAGGFPEIFVEMFGLFFLLPVLLLFGIVMALVFSIFFASLRRGKLLSMLMAGFIIYGCMLTVYNGMLNQYFVMTFWIKLVLLSVFYISPPISLPKLTAFTSSTN